MVRIQYNLPALYHKKINQLIQRLLTLNANSISHTATLMEVSAPSVSPVMLDLASLGKTSSTRGIDIAGQVYIATTRTIYKIRKHLPHTNSGRKKNTEELDLPGSVDTITGEDNYIIKYYM